MALPWLSAKHVDVSLGDQQGPLLAVFAVLALFALVGLGAGALMRNQIVAVSVGVIFMLVLDNLILAIPGVKHVYPYLPSGASSAILTDAARRPRPRNGVTCSPGRRRRGARRCGGSAWRSSAPASR